jgi:hypothetical protein
LTNFLESNAPQQQLEVTPKESFADPPVEIGLPDNVSIASIQRGKHVLTGCCRLTWVMGGRVGV